MITLFVEGFLWWAIFHTSGINNVGGHSYIDYLQYILWSVFFARICISWSFEYKMINDVEMGSVNALLLRPFSFFNFYWGQVLGYKIGVGMASLSIPFLVSLYFAPNFNTARLIPILLMVFLYLFFIFNWSFVMATLAFSWNKVYSLSVAKNLIFIFFSGELYPIDLIPQKYLSIVEKLPFPCAVYYPVAYLTQRIGDQVFYSALLRLCLYNLVLYVSAQFFWKRALKTYTGTGA
jgi:ABC-2 type transport system permease protein